MNGKCPICSAPLIESEITLSDGSKSPKQLRCSNIVCDGHRDPSAMEAHRMYVEAKRMPSKSEAPSEKKPSKK
jgi:hypothetical protein